MADHRNWTCAPAVYHYGSRHCARLQGLQCRRSYLPHADDPHKYGAWNRHVPGNHCLGAIRVRFDLARALTVAWKVIEKVPPLMRRIGKGESKRPRTEMIVAIHLRNKQ